MGGALSPMLEVATGDDGWWLATGARLSALFRIPLNDLLKCQISKRMRAQTTREEAWMSDRPEIVAASLERTPHNDQLYS